MKRYFNPNGANWSAILLSIIPFVNDMFKYWTKTRSSTDKINRIKLEIRYYSQEAKAKELIEKLEVILHED